MPSLLDLPICVQQMKVIDGNLEALSPHLLVRYPWEHGYLVLAQVVCQGGLQGPNHHVVLSIVSWIHRLAWQSYPP